MFRIFRDYVYSFIAIAASFVTLVLYWKEVSNRVDDDALVAISFIGALLIWFFAENLYLKAKWGRERKYSQVITYISDGFSEVHNLARSNSNTDAVKRACELLCDNLAKAFTLITGTKCNASIKILVEDIDENNNKKLKTITLARNRNLARNPKNNSIKHWVDQNTDFLTILKNIDSPGGANFYSNLLPFRYGYHNTSFTVYRGELPDNNPLLRNWRWPLPYKSTIVVPICPCSDQSRRTLIGFLCVDSEKLGAFRREYDVALLTGVSDGIYNALAQEAKRLQDSGQVPI